MKLDLKILTLTVEPSPALLWCWRYRNHFKRYWKRHIPSLALTCDWCGGPIEAGSIQQTTHPIAIAGCLDCAERWGTAWPYAARTEQEALDGWRRTGGSQFVQPDCCGWPGPPWVTQ